MSTFRLVITRVIAKKATDSEKLWSYVEIGKTDDCLKAPATVTHQMQDVNYE